MASDLAREIKKYVGYEPPTVELVEIYKDVWVNPHEVIGLQASTKTVGSYANDAVLIYLRGAGTMLVYIGIYKFDEAVKRITEKLIAAPAVKN